MPSKLIRNHEHSEFYNMRSHIVMISQMYLKVYLELEMFGTFCLNLVPWVLPLNCASLIKQASFITRWILIGVLEKAKIMLCLRWISRLTQVNCASMKSSVWTNDVPKLVLPYLSWRCFDRQICWWQIWLFSHIGLNARFIPRWFIHLRQINHLRQTVRLLV